MKADLAEEEQLLGTITNNLDFPLSQCILVYGHWAYELGTIGPGQPVSLTTLTPQSDLQTRWTGGRLAIESGRETEGVYDRNSTDASYVLRTMMFYEAAGGRNYTGLSDEYQRFVDFSELLKTGRAVLVARVRQSRWRCPRRRRGANGRSPLFGQAFRRPSRRPLPLRAAGEN